MRQWELGGICLKKEVLKKLYEYRGNYISGEEISSALGISRTAVWKHVNNLKNEGYVIETAHKKGYRLTENENKLLPYELEWNLRTNKIGKKLIYLDSVDSTNTFSKKIAAEEPHGTIVISEEQTSGRGRMGKGWVSPKGEGVWMSIILKPPISPYEASKITQIAGAAVCKAIRDLTDLNSLIKWPNDIVVNGKKVCGILTELAGELNEISYLIVGVGINANIKNFPEEVRDKATSLAIEKEGDISRKMLICSVLENFEVLYYDFIERGTLEKTLDICRKYSAVLHKQIRVIQGKQQKNGIALEITEEGYLRVKLDEEEETVILSGEVSIRGAEGYI